MDSALESLELGRPPVSMMDGVTAFALADDGTMLYARGLGAAGDGSELVWVDREGAAAPVEPQWSFDRGGANAGWSLSPDGTHIALRIRNEAGNDICIKELGGGPPSRLTLGAPEERKPRWSGRPLVLRTAGTQDLPGGRDLRAFTPGVDSAAVPLLPTDRGEASPDVSQDGRWLAYSSTRDGTASRRTSGSGTGG